MKIVFLSDAKSYHTKRWVNYFVYRGHQCFLFTLEKGSINSTSKDSSISSPPNGGFDTKAEEFLIPTTAPPNFLKYPLSLRKIRKIVNRIKPDLINAHFVPSYGFIGALLKIHPLVISTWGSDVLISPGKSWLHKLRAKYVLKKADLVTADAKVTAEAVYNLGVEREKVVISPMGVEKHLIAGQEKSELGSLETEKPYLFILSNRRLEPLYDIATLLKAIPLVIKEAKKDVKFIILGEGSQKSQLIHLSRELKIEGYVEFKGVVSREKLLQYYRNSDIYVSTSKSDSTSVSLLEAMSFGAIPVVTDIPGNREWIEDHENGFLFPRYDHKALANKIIYAINEFTHRADFRENNRTIIQEKGVWENNMKVIEEEFYKLLQMQK
jgi:glycosyltransferase involved in cell wall biosynthesis